VTVRIGILGAGNISETHARAAAAIDNVEIVAVHGANAQRVERLATTYHAQPFTDLEAFLAHQAMDLVAIGSPSGLHAEQGIRAASRGLHVLTEKPIDVSTRKADALIEACDNASIKLGVFFQDRAQPDIVRLHDAVHRGRIGHPLVVSARVKWYRPPEYYSQSRWRGTWTLDGGGALMNQGIHTVDLLQWIFGPVSRVSARTKTSLHRIEVEDTAVALLEFANGAVGTIEATTAAYPGYKRRVEFTGTEGTLILEHDRLIAADLKQPADDLLAGDAVDQNLSASSPVVSDVRGHQRILEDFIHAIQSGREPTCSGREGRRSVVLVEAIYKAQRTGAWTDVAWH
jgi:UDP-N-acetyl-2-amino-2-deoxyglucuronate dehydrogenase